MGQRPFLYLYTVDDTAQYKTADLGISNGVEDGVKELMNLLEEERWSVVCQLSQHQHLQHTLKQPLSDTPHHNLTTSKAFRELKPQPMI